MKTEQILLQRCYLNVCKMKVSGQYHKVPGAYSMTSFVALPSRNVSQREKSHHTAHFVI